MKKFLNSEKFKLYFQWSFLLLIVFFILVFTVFHFSKFSIMFSDSLSCFPDISRDEFIVLLSYAAAVGGGFVGLWYFIFMLIDFPHRYTYDTGRLLKELLDRIDAIDPEEDPE